MLDRLLLIRPVPLICLISISKRYVRTTTPVNPSTSTESSSASTNKEEKTAIDSSGKIFAFKHGYTII